ncbi:MAG: hypothetical protein ACK4GT_01085 [Pararhodobacter sp.]
MTVFKFLLLGLIALTLAGVALGLWVHTREGGRIPGDVSSLRHYADHGVTIAFQINTDVGFLHDSSDLAPAIECALADLAMEALP